MRWLKPERNSMLGRLLGRTATPPLAPLLPSYPPFDLPYPFAPSGTAAAQQAEANLAHLLSQRPARLAALAALLKPYELDLPAGLEAADPQPLLNGLHAWSSAAWRPLCTPALVDATQWRRSRWDRSAPALYSVMADVGLVLGELLMRQRPDYAWGLDLDPARRDQDTWRRPLLQRLAGQTHADVAEQLDVLALAFHQAWTLATQGELPWNTWAEAVRRRVAQPPVEQPAAPTPHPSAIDPAVLDHVDDHLEAVLEEGHAPERAAHLAWLFLRWLAERQLLALQPSAATAKALQAFHARQGDIGAVLSSLGNVLRASDLSPPAARFAQAYFHRGNATGFTEDCLRTLAPDADSIYDVAYSEAHYERLRPVLDARWAAYEGRA